MNQLDEEKEIISKYLENKLILAEIELLLKIEKKSNCPYTNYVIALVYKKLYENTNNIKYLSIYFSRLFKSTYYGNSDARFRLGTVYLKGGIVEINNKVAYGFLKEASFEGQHEASFECGLINFRLSGEEGFSLDLAYDFWFRGAFENNPQCIGVLKCNFNERLYLKYLENIQQYQRTDTFLRLATLYKHGIFVKKNNGEVINYLFKGLEKENLDCLPYLEEHFRENSKEITIYKRSVDSGFERFQKRWELIKEYKLDKVKLNTTT